jgi:acyl-CoA reductase-like NAD-dependent aldehyde dehydrogenase
MLAGVPSPAPDKRTFTVENRRRVHRSVYDEVLERYVARTNRLAVGDPLDAATDIGPLISVAHRDGVDACVRESVAEGATVVTSGAPPAHLDGTS